MSIFLTLQKHFRNKFENLGIALADVKKNRAYHTGTGSFLEVLA